MATGMARGAASRGKRIAFGDGHKIIWDPHSQQVFRNNPNVAPPGSEGAADLDWIAFYKGHRLYNKPKAGRWLWNMEFRPKPGEMFFDEAELALAERCGSGFVVIEPNVPAKKTVAPNKTWPFERYQLVATRLRTAGYKVCQFTYSGARRLSDVTSISSPNFRSALAVLARAALYVGPEGGLHHGAAAVGIDAVVLFGGFIPPQVTGYDTHINLTGGATACGSLRRCVHCQRAMRMITVQEVEAACLKLLSNAGKPNLGAA